MDSVLYEAKDGYALITLNRPDKLNSFTEEMHGRLAEALDRVEAEGQRALVITGAGRGFCAGQDLSDRSFPTGDSPDLGATLDRLYNPLVRKIRALDLPVICAVNGVAAGAGANVALACDIVLAARSAKFIQAFAKIGLVPDGGGTWSLTRLIGEARAKALAMTAQPLPADQAAAWGLIWQAVDDSELLQTAEAMAAQFAAAPTRGLALTKQAIQAAATNSMDAQLDLERDLQRQAGRTKDYREGVAAFLEKREPKFEGR